MLNLWTDLDEQRILPINTSEITIEEVKCTINKLKNNRSPGEDLITGEMLKAVGDIGVGKLVDILNRVWQHEIVPNDWRKGIIVRIPKKGSLSDCSNWKGITLLSVPGKILSNIIYYRITEAVQSGMREEQAGFRSARGCADHITYQGTL